MLLPYLIKFSLLHHIVNESLKPLFHTFPWFHSVVEIQTIFLNAPLLNLSKWFKTSSFLKGGCWRNDVTVMMLVIFFDTFRTYKIFTILTYCICRHRIVFSHNNAFACWVPHGLFSLLAKSALHFYTWHWSHWRFTLMKYLGIYTGRNHDTPRIVFF